MITVPTRTSRTPRVDGAACCDGGGGAAPYPAVQRAIEMAQRCESHGAVAIGMESPVGVGAGLLEHLVAVGGPAAPAPLACLRVRDRDLLVCDGSGLALYTLRLGARTAGWSQRTVSYPAPAWLRALLQRPDWPRRARRLCLEPELSRSCRVPVGVVAAEARGASERGALDDGEEAIYRLSEAAAAMLQVCGKQAAKAGRALMADVGRARRPSHVPLFAMQRALGEELALGHSPAALCSRSPGFSEAADEGKMVSLLWRRLGIEGTRDGHGCLRYARVATAPTATLLCEALDLAPGQVGL
jgi:hypothetical protein